MGYKQQMFRSVPQGGTNKGFFTADTVICAGTTSTGAFQNVSNTGSTYQVLTSQGAGALPTWAELSNATFFEPLASDPSSPNAGRVWYNTTSHQFKGAIETGAAGVWTIKTSLNTSRFGVAGAGVDGGDVLSFGGGQAGIIYLGTTELYSGSGNTWTTKTSLNTARVYLGGSGISGDALSFGGQPSGGGYSAVTEVYNGGSNTWTSKASLSIARRGNAGAGDFSTDSLTFGGFVSAGPVTASTEQYNGGSNTWTSKGSMNSGIGQLAGSGTITTAYAFGGRVTAQSLANTEQFDGGMNVWSTRSNLNQRRYALGGAGYASGGSLSFYGRLATNDTRLNDTEEFDATGNVWTVRSSANYIKDAVGGAGSTSDALSFGGIDNSGTVVASNERYSGGGINIVVFDLI